jgi:hypothetical protein
MRAVLDMAGKDAATARHHERTVMEPYWADAWHGFFHF